MNKTIRELMGAREPTTLDLIEEEVRRMGSHYSEMKDRETDHVVKALEDAQLHYINTMSLAVGLNYDHFLRLYKTYQGGS